MQPNPLLGILFHGIGAASSSSCYTPQKQTTQWAWEVYWIATACFAWLILPIAGAFLTIPNYLDVLQTVPTEVLLKTFGFGMLYGIGGLTFGLGIRYIGFSLNYAIAIGLSAALGTLIPLIWNPNDGFVWTILEKFSSGPGLIVLAGIVVSILGIIICGWAGALREKTSGENHADKNLKLGLTFAIMAGVLSAVFAIALEAGKPIELAAVSRGYDLRLVSVDDMSKLDEQGQSLIILAQVGDDLHVRIFDETGKQVVDKSEDALESGEKLTGLKESLATSSSREGPDFSKGEKIKIMDLAAAVADHSLAGEVLTLLKMNAIYPFSNGGAWLTNVIGCAFLLMRNRTAGQLFKLPKGGGGNLAFYWCMAALSGAFWYFQFFFYGMGHFHMGEKFGFTSWALHMAMLILFSNMWGFFFKEWEGADRRPKRVLHLGMAGIVVACVLIGWGNYLGSKDQGAEGQPPPAATETLDKEATS